MGCMHSSPAQQASNSVEKSVKASPNTSISDTTAPASTTKQTCEDSSNSKKINSNKVETPADESLPEQQTASPSIVESRDGGSGESSSNKSLVAVKSPPHQSIQFEPIQFATCTPEGFCEVVCDLDNGNTSSSDLISEAAREFKTALLRCAGITACDSENELKLEDFFKEIDTNHDGKLDRDEIDGLVKKVQLEISSKYTDVLQTHMKEMIIGFVGTPFSELLKKFTEYEEELVSPNPRRIVFVGGTGAGKSLLCTVLTGQDVKSSEFKVGNSASSETTEPKSKVYRWFGEGKEEEFICIDTPGLDDQKGRDELHMNLIIEALQNLKYVNTIVVVINGSQIRFSESLQKMIKRFEDAFTKRFYKHCVLCLTRWSMDKVGIAEREENGQTEESVTADLNNQIKESGFNLDCNVDLPVVFVDSKYQLRDPDGGKDRLRRLQEVSSDSVFRTEDLSKLCPEIVRVTNLDQSDASTLDPDVEGVAWTKKLQANTAISAMEASTLDPDVKVIKWTIVPTLPSGLVLDDCKGVISGSPTATTPSQTYELIATSIGGDSESFKFDLEVIHSDKQIKDMVFETMELISEQLDQSLLDESKSALDDETAQAMINEARMKCKEILNHQIEDLKTVHGNISTFQSIVDEMNAKFEQELNDGERQFLQYNQRLLTAESAKKDAENKLQMALVKKTKNFKGLKKLLVSAEEAGANPKLIEAGKMLLSEITVCPCKYEADGCKASMMSRDLASHEKVCLFSLPLLTKASAVGIPGIASKTPPAIIVETNSGEKASWAGKYNFDDGEYYLMNQDEMRLQRIKPATENAKVGEEPVDWVLTSQTEQNGPQAEIARSSNSCVSSLDAIFDYFSFKLPMTYKWADSPTYVRCAESSVKLIYFGGKWCGYCPPFTAKLAEFYKSVVAQKGPDALQVIFCSSDRDENAMFEYYMEEHGDWLAVPYKKRDIKNSLSEKFSVRGIPTCLLIDNSMEDITGSLEIRSMLEEISATPGPEQDADALKILAQLERQVTLKSIKTPEVLGVEKTDIFCSLRFGNSMVEAKMVQQKLKEEYNLNAVIINVPEGEDIADQVAQKLDEAKLVLIFGCETYGQGTVYFSTKEELQFVQSEKKSFFLIKMCEKFKEARTRMAFHQGIAYKIWMHGQPMPNDLITAIVNKFNTVDDDCFSDSG